MPRPGPGRVPGRRVRALMVVAACILCAAPAAHADSGNEFDPALAQAWALQGARAFSVPPARPQLHAQLDPALYREVRRSPIRPGIILADRLGTERVFMPLEQVEPSYEQNAIASVVIARWLGIPTPDVRPASWHGQPGLLEEPAAGVPWDSLYKRRNARRLLDRLAATPKAHALRPALHAYFYLTRNERRQVLFQLTPDGRRLRRAVVVGLERTLRGRMLAMRRPD